MLRRSNPAGLGPPHGLYSHMSHLDGGELHFVAGQMAIDEDGEVIGKGDLGAQLHEVFRRLELAAASVGLGLSDVVQYSSYVVGPDLIREFYAARETIFKQIYPTGDYPPNTLVAVAGLVEPELLVEVQAVLAG